MRNFLDKLYLGSAYFAAINLILILLIICTQMMARWTGFTFPGATAYAGYAMANSAFFCPCSHFKSRWSHKSANFIK